MKIGDLMFVKTTNETVIVLSLPKGNCDLVDVRRPVGTKDNGIEHHLDVFHVCELQTEAEAAAVDTARQLADYHKGMKLLELTKPQAKPAESVH